MNIYPLNNRQCATQEYSVREPTQPTLSELQNALEDHLAVCHYHQTALVTLATHETTADKNEWELGAHLTNHQLQKRSEQLIKQLNHIKHL